LHKKQFEERYNLYLVDEKPSVNIVDVEEACNKLKKGKASGFDRVSAEHLHFAHPCLLYCLTKLFNLMLFCRFVPDAFGTGIMIPLLKDNNGDPSACDNYRCITISCVISKVFEHVLLKKFHTHLASSDLQFGFKKGVGCSDALFTLKSVVDHFVRNGSTVTLSALDISKAFDKVSHYHLYNITLNKNIPKCLIQLLISKCFVCVKWGSACSGYFSVLAGVRQGGVLSPVLFALYIDEILQSLKCSRIGCTIGSMYLGCILYADDILLLSTSVVQMQRMLDICSAGAHNLDLKFNVTKSQVLRIGPRYKSTCEQLRLDMQELHFAAEIKYLGVVIQCHKFFTCSYACCKLKFYRCFNAL